MKRHYNNHYERKLQNYRPMKLTALDNCVQYFEGRIVSSKQKVTKYLARERERQAEMYKHEIPPTGDCVKQKKVVILVCVL
jgi:hypothetical protein